MEITMAFPKYTLIFILTETAIVVGNHQPEQSITGYSRILLRRILCELDRHTSPIIGNFQALGIAQSAICFGSAIKMHKCIFAASPCKYLSSMRFPSESYTKLSEDWNTHSP